MIEFFGEYLDWFVLNSVKNTLDPRSSQRNTSIWILNKMEDERVDSSLLNSIFELQCNYVKNYYSHIFETEEMQLFDRIIALPIGERRLLYTMYNWELLLKFSYLRKTSYFYISKCNVKIINLNDVLFMVFYNV